MGDPRPGRIFVKMHLLEVMATEIYRMQRRRMTDVHERDLFQQAMENEAHHRETFARLLAARGGRPSGLKPLLAAGGRLLGWSTALVGRRVALKASIAFERKAVTDYGKILATTPFSQEERAFVAEFAADEQHHVETWTALLKG